MRTQNPASEPGTPNLGEPGTWHPAPGTPHTILSPPAFMIARFSAVRAICTL